MRITKNQLKQIIKEELEAVMGEKKFPDLTGDGKVTRADILKGRGVNLDEETAIGDVESKASKGAKLSQKIHGKPQAPVQKKAADIAAIDKEFGQGQPESKATMSRKIDKVFGQEG